jgi:hypothetical protein
VGLTSTLGNLKFTCIKSGKKLIWNKGVLITKSTPSPSATLDEGALEQIVLSDWSQWKSKKLNDAPAMSIILQEGYSKDWEDISRTTITHMNNILNGNGLKLVQTPIWVYAETEEFRAKIFSDFAPGSSCKPPYMKDSEETIYCATADIGSGGLRIGKPGVKMANGYTLNSSDKKLLTYFIAHDMAIFYEVQAQYGDTPYTGLMFQLPSWIREGTAQLLGVLVANDLSNSSKSYLDLISKGGLVGGKPIGVCGKDLQNAEGKDKFWPDNCSYSMNFYAVQLLVAKHGGLDALLNFPKLYGKSNDWVASFKEAFAISREDFYKEWWGYLGVKESQFPKILDATPPERY